MTDYNYILYDTRINSFFVIADWVPAEMRGDYAWAETITVDVMPIPLDAVQAYVKNVRNRLNVELASEEIHLVPVTFESGEMTPLYAQSFPITDMLDVKELF